jgi:hypothetical protein
MEVRLQEIEKQRQEKNNQPRRQRLKKILILGIRLQS